MAEHMKNERELADVAKAMRGTFQDLLKNHVKDKSDAERLAKVLGVSVSLIKKMLYQGEGGLDVWTKAFAYLYDLDNGHLQDLRDGLRRIRPTSESDKIWFAIKTDLGASEDELLYLASCAHEAFKIKSELESLKKKRRGKK